ncbi:hypothetical protein TcWFU_007495 [Taenia crassiceps]|uniref:Uncharacterized protein n=1 Tax=Taenia crassiceps TaxID=6207 RepID=A0ABR4Q2T6_9CEST
MGTVEAIIRLLKAQLVMLRSDNLDIKEVPRPQWFASRRNIPRTNESRGTLITFFLVLLLHDSTSLRRRGGRGGKGGRPLSDADSVLTVKIVPPDRCEDQIHKSARPKSTSTAVKGALGLSQSNVSCIQAGTAWRGEITCPGGSTSGHGGTRSQVDEAFPTLKRQSTSICATVKLSHQGLRNKTKTENLQSQKAIQSHLVGGFQATLPNLPPCYYPGVNISKRLLIR